MQEVIRVKPDCTLVRRRGHGPNAKLDSSAWELLDLHVVAIGFPRDILQYPEMLHVQYPPNDIREAHMHA